jgi:hypothetical protein
LAKKRVRPLKQEFFINHEEEQLISEKMQEAGIKNKSAYLRKMALDGYIIKQDYEVLKGVTCELNRIGNNLNQMTKIANTYHDINQSELKTIEGDIEKIWKILISQI